MPSLKEERRATARDIEARLRREHLVHIIKRRLGTDELNELWPGMLKLLGEKSEPPCTPVQWELRSHSGYWTCQICDDGVVHPPQLVHVYFDHRGWVVCHACITHPGIEGTMAADDYAAAKKRGKK